MCALAPRVLWVLVGVSCFGIAFCLVVCGASIYGVIVVVFL
ncbi:hypothetical protein Hanom_Chr02g00136841 [Helianthus anomalus]